MSILRRRGRDDFNHNEPASNHQNIIIPLLMGGLENLTKKKNFNLIFFI